jgi:hypothetical protein
VVDSRPGSCPDSGSGVVLVVVDVVGVPLVLVVLAALELTKVVDRVSRVGVTRRPQPVRPMAAAVTIKGARIRRVLTVG